MIQKNLSNSKLTLSEVKEQFKLWRKTRKSPKPIPCKLWDAAAKLSETYSINQISKALCLNHTSLKERAHKIKKASIQEIHPPSFVELNFKHSPLVSECIVEMENSAGAKMRMYFKGKMDLDLLELVKAFWKKGA
ncbi:MAG: hypothetical protein J7K84_03595 [Deltaproteobacteria bacterium]|nr:hypothetical protein [Deltaproteobacteria bacterium]